MWEAIRSNHRRTLWLFALSSLLVAGAFFLLGEAVQTGGGLWTVAVGLLLWSGWGLLIYHFGGPLVLVMTPGRKLEQAHVPQLENVVVEMAIAAGMEQPPAIVILEEDAPNAFALGCRPDRFSVVITTGLLDALDRNELQGVVAHEIGHMINGDSLFMTFTGILLGMPVMARHSFRLPVQRDRRFTRIGRCLARILHGILFFFSLLFAVMAPFVTRLFYFTISRTREFLADATAVRLTRYPAGLASALRKINAFPGAMRTVNGITAPMCTVNPLEKSRIPVISWFRTHPDTKERIDRLAKIGAGVADNSQENAFSSPVAKRKEILVSPPIRISRKGRGWQSITCDCGAEIQISPFFRGGELRCRHCGQKVIVR